jgi:hypothetical protein
MLSRKFGKTATKLYSGARVRGEPPTAEGDYGPHRFDEAEGPCSLEKAIGGAERARSGKAEDEPRAAFFAGVAHQHRRDGEQSEK